MTTESRRILVSGGGIAGLTLAFWLRRQGFEPTVVEAACVSLVSGQGAALAMGGAHPGWAS